MFFYLGSAETLPASSLFSPPLVLRGRVRVGAGCYVVRIPAELFLFLPANPNMD
jgi:hypothetical protein